MVMNFQPNMHFNIFLMPLLNLTDHTQDIFFKQKTCFCERTNKIFAIARGFSGVVLLHRCEIWKPRPPEFTCSAMHFLILKIQSWIFKTSKKGGFQQNTKSRFWWCVKCGFGCYAKWIVDEVPNENFHEMLRFTLEHLLGLAPSSDFEMWLSGKIQQTTNLCCWLKHKLKAAIDVDLYLYREHLLEPTQCPYHWALQVKN